MRGEVSEELERLGVVAGELDGGDWDAVRPRVKEGLLDRATRDMSGSVFELSEGAAPEVASYADGKARGVLKFDREG